MTQADCPVAVSFNWVGRLSIMTSRFCLQGMQVVKLAVCYILRGCGWDVIPTELSVIEKLSVYTDVTWYILVGTVHFLLKPVRLLASGLGGEFSAVFFLLFSLHLFQLLLYVPGLHTTLWTEYSSSGLITANEGLIEGNSRLTSGS